MKSLATANKKISLQERGGPMIEPKACILARVADEGHRPMLPLTRISRIHRAGVDGRLHVIKDTKLSDGRNLTDVLKSTLNGDGGICGDLVGRIPNSRDSLLKKTLDEITLLLTDQNASLEKVMDKDDARMLRECLGNVAQSIKYEIEQRTEAQIYLAWMRGENRDIPQHHIPHKDTDPIPENLKKLGEGVSGTGGLIGHGI